MSTTLINNSYPARAIAITGSGGSGAVTACQILLAAVARAGYYGLMTRSAGPQIRGGESAAMLRYAAQPVACMGDVFDILVGLDWNNIDRFIDEIPLGPGSFILNDPDTGPAPENLWPVGAKVLEIPFKKYAEPVEGGRVNMAAIGATGAIAGLPLDAMEAAVNDVLGRKGKAVVASSLACIRAAWEDTRAMLSVRTTLASRYRAGALEHQRQRGERTGRDARRHTFRRCLPDHARQRDTRMAGAASGKGRRAPCCRRKTNSPR